MTDQNQNSLEWQRKNKAKRRAHLRKWYYIRRREINLSFSLPKSSDLDEVDIKYIEEMERWNPW